MKIVRDTAKQKILAILLDELTDVGCWNCEYSGEDEWCDICNKKDIVWSLSKGIVNELASRITDVFCESRCNFVIDIEEMERD